MLLEVVRRCCECETTSDTNGCFEFVCRPPGPGYVFPRAVARTLDEQCPAAVRRRNLGCPARPPRGKVQGRRSTPRTAFRHNVNSIWHPAQRSRNQVQRARTRPAVRDPCPLGICPHTNCAEPGSEPERGNPNPASEDLDAYGRSARASRFGRTDVMFRRRLGLPVGDDEGRRRCSAE